MYAHISNTDVQYKMNEICKMCRDITQILHEFFSGEVHCPTVEWNYICTNVFFLNNLTSFSSLDHIVTMRVTYSGLVKTRLGGIPRHQACNIRPADYTKCKTTKAWQSHERDDFLDTWVLTPVHLPHKNLEILSTWKQTGNRD